MQSEQLAYAIVTPYSIRKSRTGGIIARLISRTGLDLVAARMFAPGKELVERYAETIVTENDARHRATQELIRQYVLQNFTGENSGQRARALFLVLRGADQKSEHRRLEVSNFTGLIRNVVAECIANRLAAGAFMDDVP